MPVKRGHVAPQNTFIDTLIQKFDSQGRRFFIANAMLPNIPIIFCNDDLCTLCGYSRAELLQRSANLSFLYGPLTSSKAIHGLNFALGNCEERLVVIVLYDKAGKLFLAKIAISPVRDAEGQVRLYILTFAVEDTPQYEIIGPQTTRPSTNVSLAESNKSMQQPAAMSFTARLGRFVSRLAPRWIMRRSSSTSSSDRLRHHYEDGESFVALPDNSLADLGGGDDDQAESRHEADKGKPGGAHRSKSDRLTTKTTDYLHHRGSSGGDSKRQRHDSLPPESASSSGPSIRQRYRRKLSLNTSHHHHHGNANNGLLLSTTTSGAIVVGGVASGARRNVSDKVAEMLSLDPDVSPEKKLYTPSSRIHPFTLKHYGPVKAVWDWLVLLFVIYTAIFTPYSASFHLPEARNSPKWNMFSGASIADNPLVVFDLFVDIMFLIDIFINFRTTYVNKNDELVSHPWRIAVHYFKGWFLIDVVAAIPFDLLLVGDKSDDRTTLVGLLKTARLLRLVRVVRKLDRYSEYGAAVLLLLMATFCLIAHWLACIWYAIGNIERNDYNISIGWLDTLAHQIKQPFKSPTSANRSSSTDGPSMRDKYVTALYFTFSSLTSVGFGNVSPTTNPEKVFSIFVMLIGSLMYAGIFGHVSAIIQRLYSGTARYHTQMLRVKEFIRFHRIPNPLKRRLEEFFQHAWSYTNGIDMNLVLRGFPEFLQADICLHLNHCLFNSKAPFKGASTGCLRSLGLKMKTCHAPPGDTLVHKGDLISFLYFIARGSIEIIDASDNQIVAVLCQGDVLGESPTLRLPTATGLDDLQTSFRPMAASGGGPFIMTPSLNQSAFNVRALTYCDLHKIQHEDLAEIFEMYPEFARQFCTDLEVTFELKDPNMSTSPWNTIDPFLIDSPPPNLRLVESTSFSNVPPPLPSDPSTSHVDNEQHQQQSSVVEDSEQHLNEMSNTGTIVNMSSSMVPAWGDDEPLDPQSLEPVATKNHKQLSRSLSSLSTGSLPPNTLPTVAVAEGLTRLTAGHSFTDSNQSTNNLTTKILSYADLLENFLQVVQEASLSPLPINTLHTQVSFASRFVVLNVMLISAIYSTMDRSRPDFATASIQMLCNLDEADFSSPTMCPGMIMIERVSFIDGESDCRRLVFQSNKGLIVHPSRVIYPKIHFEFDSGNNLQIFETDEVKAVPSREFLVGAFPSDTCLLSFDCH